MKKWDDDNRLKLHNKKISNAKSLLPPMGAQKQKILLPNSIEQPFHIYIRAFDTADRLQFHWVIEVRATNSLCR